MVTDFDVTELILSVPLANESPWVTPMAVMVSLPLPSSTPVLSALERVTGLSAPPNRNDAEPSALPWSAAARRA